MAHIDLTLEGLRETLRWARRDMRDAADPIFEAEARREAGEKDVRVPRFAAYSVWVGPSFPSIPIPFRTFPSIPILVHAFRLNRLR